ncbi:MAG: DUF4173 domain-containing protein [Oscillospiraceae bacterium]|nr:DUF4173 domain-containing protein [Oscillospiraceae bacterium]
MNETFDRYPSDPVLSGPDAAEPFVSRPAPEGERHRRLRADCPYYLILAAAVGAACALCFVRTGGLGLNAVLYAAVWSVCAHLALRRLGLARLRRDGVWYAGILLLALTVFWTADPMIQSVSILGCFLLQCFWSLNAFAALRDWHFGKAAAAVLRLVFRTVGRCFEPFSHLAARRKTGEGRGRGRYVVLGLLIALPLAAAVTALLASADAVFRALFDRLFTGWNGRELSTALQFLVLFLLAGLAFYGVLCAQTDRPEPEAQRPPRRTDALVAVTFTAVLAVIYLVFCAIQIAVLFRGRAAVLPEGTTYAQYAREGFFQLLLVSGINVALVIVSQRRFTGSAALRALLCVISGCTCVMELSSAWRMILYVQVYGLTFLRLLVLWFLLVLAVILAGAVIAVFRPFFRLFRFSLAVCLAAWLVFAFARPDALAARYDLQRFGCTHTSLSLIRYELSADALGELRPYLPGQREAIGVYLDGYLDQGIPAQYKGAGLRGFNYSLWQANETAKEYVHEN